MNKFIDMTGAFQSKDMISHFLKTKVILIYYEGLNLMTAKSGSAPWTCENPVMLVSMKSRKCHGKCMFQGSVHFFFFFNYFLILHQG